MVTLPDVLSASITSGSTYPVDHGLATFGFNFGQTGGELAVVEIVLQQLAEKAFLAVEIAQRFGIGTEEV